MELEGAYENATPLEVRTAECCAPTKEGFIRFQAVELLELGYDKCQVAQISHRSLRTINRWIEAYRARGIDGLAILQLLLPLQSTKKAPSGAHESRLSHDFCGWYIHNEGAMEFPPLRPLKLRFNSR